MCYGHRGKIKIKIPNTVRGYDIKMISAIFDFDGVLVDSRPAIGTCLKESLLDYGIEEPNHVELSILIGPPLEIGLTRFLTQRGLNLDIFPDILTRFRDSYARKSIQNTCLYPGVNEMLQDFYVKKIPMYIATSKPRFLTIPLIKKLKIEKYFKIVQAPSGDGVEDKIETLKNLLRAMLNFNKLNSERIFMIGDREADVLAARDTNVESIGGTWGYGTQEELLAANPDYLVESPKQLIQLLTRGGSRLIEMN